MQARHGLDQQDGLIVHGLFGKVGEVDKAFWNIFHPLTLLFIGGRLFIKQMAIYMNS